jgi:hypothetical protein
MLPKQNKETQITAIVDMLGSTANSRLNCTDCLEPLQLCVFLASFTELQSKHKTLRQTERILRFAKQMFLMQQVRLLLLESCGKQIAKSLAETETRYQTCGNAG